MGVRIMRSIKLTAALLVALLLLCSCTGELKYDSSLKRYVNNKTGAAYIDAPMYYEACEVGEKYAVWKNDYITVDFYTIEGADPLLWLTEEGGTVFYSDKATLPELTDLNVTEVMIGVEGNDRFFTSVEVTSPEHIAALIEAWETGESIEYPAITANATYRVKFVSDNYPFLYYSLIYLEYSDGAYLYCRDNGRCVPAGSLIRQYLDGEQ